MLRSVRTLAIALTALTLVAWAPPPLGAPVQPAGSIHPGIGAVTQGSYCTTNFVFEGERRVGQQVVRDTYLGIAAHCATTSGSTSTDGCESGTHPIGTVVELRTSEGTVEGTLAYSSWITMRARGETPGSDVCRGNDFALVRIPTSLRDDVDPTIPYFGGPVGIRGATATGDGLRAYGNSSLRLGVSTSSPMRGATLLMQRAGWTHRVYLASPGVPGDSGSAVLDDEGRAVGVLSTLGITPYPAANGVADLQKALEYANAHGGIGTVRLVEGRAPFDDPLTP